MAKWPDNPVYTPLSEINKGNEYEPADGIVAKDINAFIENVDYLNKAIIDLKKDLVVVVQGTGQSTTDVMSQKAVTDSLNLLEAKLNENIVKDPSKTYAVIKGSECHIENGSSLSSGSIDFGDGTIVNFPTPDFEFTHTYTDGVDMHIVSVSGVTQLPSVLFSNHAGPIKVITGDNVTSIGGGICNGCTNLEEFVIGKNVTDITSFSIIFDTPIKILRVLATTPPTCASYDAQVPNLEKIIVPKSAINAYKAATGWSQYANKIVYEVDSSDIEIKYDKTGGTIGGNVDITGNLTVQKKLKCETAPAENNDVLRYQDTAVEVETSLMGA